MPENQIDDKILQLLNNQQSFEKGFKLLVDTYQEKIYWHVRRMVFAHELTDDVVQNTFVKVYKGIKKFKRESKLYTWLYRIATNEAITMINKEKKRSTSSIDIRVQSLSSDSYFDGSKAMQLLKEAVDQLPEKQQLVFNMRYYDELSYNDISEVLKTSVGGLKASYHHAVKKIESFVKKNAL